jgi:hypothetical protein
LRLPHVRLTVRSLMAVVVLVGLLLGWAAHCERLRRQKYRLINQDISVSAAEANYLNAGLARGATEAAIARYTKENGKDENATLKGLRDAAIRARQKELDLEAVWKQEKHTLSKLILEHYNSWQ